jgi:hypothetical protein
MRSHRQGDDHDPHNHHHGQPTPEEVAAYEMTKVVGKCKVIDAVIDHIAATVEKLKALGMDAEDALRTSVRLHNAESEFFDDHSHGGHS